ncbi:MAG: AraC family transcriptional regulator [Alcanivorax sp.]|uniref:AraC family transcriptional regulator n=1 Tax=Alcanivorax sp. TaxID=1872427 RepID=UPI003DA701B4
MENREKQQGSAEMAALSVLKSKLMHIARNDGDYTTALPALTVHRRDSCTDPLPCIYDLGLAVSVAGDKQVSGGDRVFEYGAGEGLFASADMPVVTRVIEATPTHPYVGAMLRFDPQRVMQVAAGITVPQRARQARATALTRLSLDAPLLEALSRYVGLLDEPALCSTLAPLVEQEIIARLLVSDAGPLFMLLNASGSPSRQITRTMAWLKQHYNESISMDALAEQAHMSASSFRQHFKAIAGMSPLQYLKTIRLQEARQLMLNDGLDAGTSGLQVGYESVSQFSREYARLFGAPPLRDIKQLRERASRPA